MSKKTKDDQSYEEVVRTMSRLRLSNRILRNTGLDNREYVLLESDLERKDVVGNMKRKYYQHKEDSDAT